MAIISLTIRGLKLLPCLCGKAPYIDMRDMVSYITRCDECELKSKVKANPMSAILSWNSAIKAEHEQTVVNADAFSRHNHDPRD